MLSLWDANIQKEAYLPKFNLIKDLFNGMRLSVNDVHAVQITLKSLVIKDDTYEAKLCYKGQDHFGLDKLDIMHPLYRQIDMFRIWFVLQRYNEFGYRPFFTNMMADDITITGKRSTRIIS